MNLVSELQKMIYDAALARWGDETDEVPKDYVFDAEMHGFDAKEEWIAAYLLGCVPESRLGFGAFDLLGIEELREIDPLISLAVESGYVQIARGGDGSHYFVNLTSGRVFHLWIGTIDEESIYIPGAQDDYSNVEVSVVNDDLMEKAAQQHWGNLQDLFQAVIDAKGDMDDWP